MASLQNHFEGPLKKLDGLIEQLSSKVGVEDNAVLEQAARTSTKSEKEKVEVSKEPLSSPTSEVKHPTDVPKPTLDTLPIVDHT